MSDTEDVFCKLLGHKMEKRGVVLVEQVDGSTKVQDRKVIKKCQRWRCDHVEELDESWDPPYGSGSSEQ